MRDPSQGFFRVVEPCFCVPEQILMLLCNTAAAYGANIGVIANVI